MLRKLGQFITRKPLAIVAIWAIILIVSLPLALGLDQRLHYDITSFIPKDMESYMAKDKYQAQFPGEYKTQIVVAVESDNKTSAMRFIDDINKTVGRDATIKNVTATTSIYDIQRQALVEMTPSLHSTLYELYDNASKTDRDLYDARDTVKNTSGLLYDLRDSVISASTGLQSAYDTVKSSSSQLYSARDQATAASSGMSGIRQGFDLVDGTTLAYAQVFAARYNGSNLNDACNAAYGSTMGMLPGMHLDPGQTQLAGAWIGTLNGVWKAEPSAGLDRIIRDTGAQFLGNPQVNGALTARQKAVFGGIIGMGGQGTNDYRSQAMLKQDVIAMAMQAQGLTSDDDRTKLSAIYDLGVNPPASAVDDFVLATATQGMSPSDARSARDIYALGRDPSHSAIASYVVNKACEGHNDTEQGVIRDVWNMGSMSMDTIDNYVLTKAGEGHNQTEKDQIKDIYAMGRNPNDTVVDAYVLKQATKDLNQTESDFVRGVYALGPNASDDVLKSYVCGKVADNLNITGNLSYIGAVMGIDRNISGQDLKDFAHDWAYSHEYNNPQIFSNEIVKNLAQGKLTLYAVMLSDETESREAHSAVTSLRNDVQQVGQGGSYPDVKAYVTGLAAFGVDTETSAVTDVSNIDKISVLLIVAILGVYFLSVLTPFVPLAVIGAAILTGFGALYLASYNVDLYYLTKTFMIVVMLGAGTDYCVFILSRYAEERGRGMEVKDSVIASIEHAGKSVICSGTTAMIGFASLMLIDNGMFNSMGQSMALAILISMLISLTLMPAVLAITGDRLFWPRKIYNTEKKATKTGRLMRRITHNVIKHWKLVLVATVLLAIPAVWLYLQMVPGHDIISMMPNSIESKVGYDKLNAGFGSGNIDRTQIVVTLPEDLKDPSGNYSISALDRVERISAIAASVPGIDKAYSMTRPEGATINYANLSSYAEITKSYYQRNMDNGTGADGRTTVINVAFNGSPYSEESDRAIDALRQKLNDYASGEGKGTVILTGGAAAMNHDYQQACTGKFNIVIAVVFAGIFIVLLALLRSIWTPVRLFVSLLMGIVWTLAAFTLVFQYCLNIPIIWILPIVLFCTLMGLGGDYVVFMMSRVREEVDKGESDEKAIEHAVEVTGPVILLCGLVMAAAFGSMMISDMAELREFGFVLSVAIILDATLMVLVLIPSIMMLLGKFNWWMPRFGAQKESPEAKKQ